MGFVQEFLAVTVLCCALNWVALGATQPTQLGLNGLKYPDIAAAAFPVTGAFVFTWLPPSGSNTSAFEFVIRDGGSFFWSSGQTASSSPIFVLPANITLFLITASSYSWRVRLWTGAPGPGDWSEFQLFDTAPAAGDWRGAQWIGGGSQVRADWMLPAALVVRAHAYVTGVGAFELHVNGAKIGNHVMDPGQAVYDQKVLFVTFNITSALHSGLNHVGALLGNSVWGYLDMFANRTATGDQSGDSTRAFLLLIIVSFADGSSVQFTSSASTWFYRHGPIVYDHNWHGEIYDARQETELPWDNAPIANFPSGTWLPAKEMQPKVGSLYSQMMPPIRTITSYSPVSVKSRSSLCAAPLLGGSAPEGANVFLGCANNQGVIDEIVFASYGTPVNSYSSDCQQFAKGACDAPSALDVVKRLCLNRSSCLVLASNELFGGDPCANVLKTLVISARGSSDCSPAPPPPGLPVNQSLVFDFGQNMAGVVTLNFYVPVVSSATTVYLRLKHAEIEDPSGYVDNYYYPGMEFDHASATCSMEDWYQRKWYECANQTDGFIINIGPGQTAKTMAYTPTFTYHGFQFMELTATEIVNGQEQPLGSSLAALFPFGASAQAHFLHSDLPPLATLALSPQPAQPQAGSLLQSIFNATIAAHVSNLWSIPTDCPQREKRGWMADAGLSASSLNTFFDSFAFHANFLRLIADNQRKLCTDQPQTSIYGPCTHSGGDPAAFYNGSVPDVTPFATGPYGSNPGTTDWQFAFVQIARSVLLHNGHLSLPLLEELWPSLTLYMNYLERLVAPDGLLYQGARGDWIPPPAAVKTPEQAVAAFSHTLSVSYMAEIATALGRADEAARYLKRFASNQAAYHKAFFKKTATSCCYDLGSQTSNVFALYLGAVPAPLINTTVDAIIKSISQPDGPHFEMGIFGVAYVFDALKAVGRDDVLLAALQQTTYPSFGYMIDHGATTLWECWDNVSLCSHNHIMFGGGVAKYLLDAAGGPSVPSGPLALLRLSDHFIVHPAPQLFTLLDSMASERGTRFGTAAVQWQFSRKNGLALNLSLPMGTTADVNIPLLSAFQDRADVFIPVETAVSVMSNAAMLCELRCSPDLHLQPGNSKYRDARMAVVVTKGDCRSSLQLATSACCVRHDGEVIMALDLRTGGNFSFIARL